MCRLFAYISVKPILLDDVLKRPKNAITQQILAHWQGTPFLNADGFGISWHTDARSDFNPFPPEVTIQKGSEARSSQKINVNMIDIVDGPFVPFVRGPHPAIYKTTIAKPLNDPIFNSLCANVSSKTIFAHVRAAWVPPVATTNNHPFVFGRHCFMHNGGIEGFNEIRKDMMKETSDGFIAMIEGGTDTEHLAALYLTYLCSPADFIGADEHYSAGEMWTALHTAIDTVEKIQTDRGIKVDNFLNICTTDGESFLALCYRSEVGLQTPPFTLWASTTVADTLNRQPYALEHGKIYEDNRSEEEIEAATRILVRDAKPCIERNGNGEVIGLNPGLLGSIKGEEDYLPGRHGPHIVVASEPTTVNLKDWYQLDNRGAILVDTVLTTHKELGSIQSIEVKPATLKPKH